MKKKVKTNEQLYVVNFFAEPLIDYARLFELQSKENISPVFDGN